MTIVVEDMTAIYCQAETGFHGHSQECQWQACLDGVQSGTNDAPVTMVW